MSAVAASYAYCESVARRQAKNFYYSFLLLDRRRRASMCAIYAFMRCCDDLSDEPGASAAALEQWRSELNEALEGRFGAHPCWPAFYDTATRYKIPPQYFHQMIDGVSSDLRPRDIQTFDELYRYCYQVASVVGLTIIHIFGFEDSKAPELAEKCGIAFQLTNIIRDVKEDQERGRVYLPREDRDRFPDLASLLDFEASRAEQYYRESRPLIEMVTPATRPALWALIEIYRRLLRRMREKQFAVMDGRIRLSTATKLSILLQAYARSLSSARR